MKTTFRLISLEDRSLKGQTAASPELARLVPGEIQAGKQRLGMEQTDWVEHADRM